MKQYIFCFIFIQLIFSISSDSSTSLKRTFMSPIGPYVFVVKQIYNCNPTKNNTIQHNMYVSRNANSTLIFGNSTLKEPFDDTLFLEIQMSVKDIFGKWKENTYSHKAPNACSSLKKLMGIGWTEFMSGLGIQNTSCPIAPGTYIATGLDPIVFEKTNFPSTFVYGTYKIFMYYTRKNEKFGCQVLIIEFKRI